MAVGGRLPNRDARGFLCDLLGDDGQINWRTVYRWKAA